MLIFIFMSSLDALLSLRPDSSLAHLTRTTYTSPHTIRTGPSQYVQLKAVHGGQITSIAIGPDKYARIWVLIRHAARAAGSKNDWVD